MLNDVQKCANVLYCVAGRALFDIVVQLIVEYERKYPKQQSRVGDLNAGRACIAYKARG